MGARTCTILFTDLVGSTALRAELGDDAFDGRRRRHDRLLTGAITRHDGELVKHEGDGVMGVFASAAEAVACAVAMQQGITRMAATTGTRFEMRVGLSAGDVAHEDGDFHGMPVVEAARLCGAATGGQILVADVVRVLSGSRAGHQFMATGLLDLKGLAEPVTAWEVAWSRDDASTSMPLRLAEVAARGACVGRDVQRQQLESAWKQSTAGTRQLVLVSGEPGIGKTRLAADLAATVVGRGRVVHGWCDEDFGVPYQPWVQALGSYLRACSDDEVASMGSSARDLTRLLPELTTRLGEAGPSSVDAESERARLFEAVDQLIERMSIDQPVLIVLDDLHWADQPTLALLRRLLRSERAGAVVFLATFRDTEIDRRYPLGKLLADLRREDRVTRISLGGLDEVGVAALLADRAGHQAPAEFARRLHDETEGNPFFAEEVLAHLAEVGAIYQRAGRWTSDVPTEDLGVPEGVRDVVGRRLSLLSDAANELLTVAAVVGREFDLSTVLAAGRLDRDAALEAVDAALDSGLVIEVAGAPGRLAFAHALVRQTLVEEIRGPRKARWHWSVGEALRASGHSPSAVVAFHLSEGVLAGDAVVAAEASVSAAEDAAAVAATEDVRVLAHRALELLGDANIEAPELRCRALLALGEASTFDSKDVAEAGPAVVEAARLAGRHGWPELASRAAVAYAFIVKPGVVEPQWLELATIGLDLGASPALRPVLLSIAGGFHLFNGDFDTARALIDEAVAHIDDCEPLGRRLVLGTYTQSSFGLPDVAKLQEIAAAEMELNSTESTFWALVAHIHAAVIALRVGQRAVFDRQLESMASVVARSGVGQPDLPTLRAAAALIDGHLAEAERIAVEVLATVDPTSSNHVNSLGQIAAVWYWTGRDEDLLVGLEGVPIDQQPQRDLVDLVRASMRARRGERDAAFDALAADDFRALSMNWTRLGCLAHAGATAAWLGDADAAITLEALLAPYAGQILIAPGAAICYDLADSVRGMLLATVGRLDEAIDCFEQATLLCDAARDVTHQVMNDHRLAGALVARDAPGDRRRAQALATDALTKATELGMHPDVRFAQSVLDQLVR